jgi:hypothetical protein
MSYINVRRLAPVLAAAALLVAGCSREPAGLEIEEGSEVSVESKDGTTVSGKLADVRDGEVVVETPAGETRRIPREEIKSLRAMAPDPPPASSAAEGTSAAAPALPEYREVQVPAGTSLSIELGSAVGSATSQVEDPVRGTLRRAITVDGVEVIPAGAAVAGVVTEAERSARVKGRARVAFRFSRVELPGDAEALEIATAPVRREAAATKKDDAMKIGAGATAGAVIGAIAGGGDGAAKGAAIGGGAGTGVVLATRGKEVTVPAGTAVSTKLLEPVVVRVRIN